MTFLERLKNEPALITSVLVAVFNLFAVDAELSGSIVQIVGVVLPLVLGLIVRQNVAGPVTKETLAKGTLQTKPTPEQKEKAAQVLGVPASLIQEAVKFAAQGLLPATWANLIVGADYSRLLEAVNEARRRAPSQSELEDHLRKKGQP